ncbi:MAG: hypothetical protein ACSLEL_01705 [Candidatus Malihini olakiniferum]
MRSNEVHVEEIKIKVYAFCSNDQQRINYVRLRAVRVKASGISRALRQLETKLDRYYAFYYTTCRFTLSYEYKLFLAQVHEIIDSVEKIED